MRTSRVVAALAAVLLVVGSASADCPPGSRPPAGKPAVPGGAPTANSEYANIQAAINILANIKLPQTDLLMQTKIQIMAICLEFMLKYDRLCIKTGGGMDTLQNSTDWIVGWVGGDQIRVGESFAAHAPPAGGGALTPLSADELCMLAAGLAHEACHTDDPPSTTMAGRKAEEKKCADVEIAVLKACGGGTTAINARIKQLQDWVKNLCRIADAHPTWPASSDCDSAAVTHATTTTPSPANTISFHVVPCPSGKRA